MPLLILILSMGPGWALTAIKMVMMTDNTAISNTAVRASWVNSALFIIVKFYHGPSYPLLYPGMPMVILAVVDLSYD
ncbi:hypothetical protein JCM14467A_06630 [Vulcanisaeta sp. JCM 14467]